MTPQGIDALTLRDRLETVGVNLKKGEATGYVSLESQLNLNAIAIGLGLENIEYEPERFPGLIHHVEEPPATVLLFGTGVITTVDSANHQAVTDAIMSTVNRISELGLVDGEGAISSVNVDIEMIPIADELDG